MHQRRVARTRTQHPANKETVIARADASIESHPGIIESSFAVAQLASALLWARLSDKVGRKPVLLFGLVGSAISSIWFGMSLSYASALAARTICGLLNGNVGVAKAVLASVTDHSKYRCVYFFLFSSQANLLIGSGYHLRLPCAH
jgi:MFS family permease